MCDTLVGMKTPQVPHPVASVVILSTALSSGLVCIPVSQSQKMIFEGDIERAHKSSRAVSAYHSGPLLSYEAAQKSVIKKKNIPLIVLCYFNCL